jgi:hypothetical protein
MKNKFVLMIIIIGPNSGSYDDLFKNTSSLLNGLMRNG